MIQHEGRVIGLINCLIFSVCVCVCICPCACVCVSVSVGWPWSGCSRGCEGGYHLLTVMAVLPTCWTRLEV